MSKVIEFDQAGRLKRELAERDDQLAEAVAKLSQLKGVNEMLKLQVLDLQDQLEAIVKQIGLIQNNLKILSNKLPNLD